MKLNPAVELTAEVLRGRKEMFSPMSIMQDVVDEIAEELADAYYPRHGNGYRDFLKKVKGK